MNNLNQQNDTDAIERGKWIALIFTVVIGFPIAVLIITQAISALYISPQQGVTEAEVYKANQLMELCLDKSKATTHDEAFVDISECLRDVDNIPALHDLCFTIESVPVIICFYAQGGLTRAPHPYETPDINSTMEGGDDN